MNTTSRPTAADAVRRHGVAAIAAVVLLLAAPALRAQARGFEVGPAPSWVEAVAPDSGAIAPPAQIAKGVHYLLSDQQIRIDGRERVSYRHSASRALDAQGVESIANLEVRFDPSYQKLALHSINVIRGGVTIPKLKAATVRILQRENDLEARIFDGSRTASIVLDDVRVGDVVDYAYSIRGQNPVFGTKQFGRLAMQWSVPVARVSARLVWPVGRELRLEYLGHAVAPAVSQSATHRDYRWDQRDVPGLQVENDAPDWYDPYRSVQWGEFSDWQAVAQWAVPLYRLPDRAAPRVQAEIARIAAEQAAPDQRLLAALRFVQREVRYLGIEIGAGSHAPSSPEVVLARRFGDCKDKTLLTVAMLRGLGIEASAALANTTQRRAIRTWQPSPGAFNHVLVRARLNGRDFWLDPTLPPQQASLARLVQADYGPSLVVDDRSTGLVAMAGDEALTQRREMHAVIDSRDGFEKPARFTMTTVTYGAAADSLRATLASQARDQLQRQYLNFYARYYEGLEVAAPFEVADDEAANQLSVTEHYVIKSLWRRASKSPRFEAAIEVPDVLAHMRQPGRQLRDSPLSLPYPIDLTHVTEVMLPSDWKGSNDRLKVADPAFEFERIETWKGANLVLNDRYRSRLDHVEAGEVGRYVANLEKARQGLNYSLYHDDPQAVAPETSSGAPHWLPAVVGVLALLGFIALARRAYAWDPEPLSPGEFRHPMPPSGLGGWLAVVALGLAFSLFRFGNALLESWPSYSTETWLAVATRSGAAYHPLWPWALLCNLVDDLGLLVMCCLVVILFLQRRSSLPRVFIAYAAFAFAATFLDAMFQLMIPALAKDMTAKTWGELSRSGISSAIWIAYFLRSGRVRLTFVRRRPDRMATQAPPAAASSAEAAAVQRDGLRAQVRIAAGSSFARKS